MIEDVDLAALALYEDREEEGDEREEPRRCLRGWEEREELTFVIEAGRRKYNIFVGRSNQSARRSDWIPERWVM